jgi:hypothetical protein
MLNQSCSSQVVGVHSTPKGYKAAAADGAFLSSPHSRHAIIIAPGVRRLRKGPRAVAGLQDFIDLKELGFSVVDTHAKDGAQPALSSGEPNWDAASQTGVAAGSLWAQVRLEPLSARSREDSLERFGPSANCSQPF